MNKKALEYVAYKAILEADITAEQKQRLIEIGLFQRVAAFLGAGKDTAGSMKKLFNDKRYARQSAAAVQNIEKELTSIMDAAEAATGSRDVVYDILKAILEKKGMQPGKVASPPSGGAGGGSGSGVPTPAHGGGVSPGQSVTFAAAQNNDEMLRQILQAVAELKGMSADKASAAATKALEKEPNLKTVAGEMTAAVAAYSGVSEDKVKKVYKWLEEGGHIEVQAVQQESFVRRARTLKSANRSWKML